MFPIISTGEFDDTLEGFVGECDLACLDLVEVLVEDFSRRFDIRFLDGQCFEIFHHAGAFFLETLLLIGGRECDQAECRH